MREGIEHKTIPPTEAIATEHLEEEASPEEEMAEVDLMLERAKTEVEEFSASGLPHAEKIATKMGTEVDEETKVALTELNKEAEFADRKNTEIISKKITEKLEEFLNKNEDYNNLDYPNADQAVEYFEAHKNSLADDDRKNLESRIKEVAKVHNERKAEILSKKTVEDLQEFLKYDHDKKDYKQAIEAVNFFITNKNSLKGYERQNQERKVFGVVENHLINLVGDYYSDEGSWQDALNKYKEIPNDFFADKNIQNIGYNIYRKAQKEGLKPEELMVAFEGNLDLLSSVLYQNKYNNFSSEQLVKIVEETYKKLGPSRYISTYKASDFDGKDREQILRPLFESYKVNNQREILSQINEMKGLYDQLSQEERNDLIKNLISGHASEVADKFDSLNLNEEQKKLLVGSLIQNKDYKYLQSEADLEKLGANKEEVFNELLKKDAASLFVHRRVFNLSSEQYKLLLDRVTGDPKEIEKTLAEIYYSHPDDKEKLTAEELQVFQSVVEKDAPHLIFRFKGVFGDAYKKLDSFFKELPKGLFENELKRFVRDVVEDLGGWEKNVEHVRALVVEAGEQKVTGEYLEQLDKLGLNLPKRVMGQIKENIRKAEQKNLLYYFRIALKENVSLEQIQREIQQKLEQVTTSADYFKAVHLDGLRHVLKDSRFKTQFETHSSNGILDPIYRAQQEAKMFNYDKSEEKGKMVRPNYGYMSDNKHGLVGNFSETYVKSSNVSMYGRIHVKLKKEQVKNRTTVTFSDSLGTADEKPPTPSIKPHFTGIGQGYSGSEIKHASKPEDWGSNYLEVQYHWPLKTEVIDSIHISEKNGLSKEEIREVEELVREYNQQYPDKKINVVVY